MTNRLKIAIVGYGNVGRGVHEAIAANNADMELYSILTRNPERTKKSFLGGSSGVDIPVKCIHDIKNELSWKSLPIDVAILCGGSHHDLPEQGPYFAKFFNTVDSFDTHANIPKYFKEMDETAKSYGKTAIISTGWDPGTFSLERVLADAFLPESDKYTFWGKGVSQGHSDALRQVLGVQDAIQYTIPKEDAVSQVRNGENPRLSTKDKHWRDCYVVLKEGADEEKIKNEIKTMPNYFADYDTEVTFVSQEDMNERKKKMPHAGSVMTSGKTGQDDKAIIEYRCRWDSNPGATGNILAAHARAAVRFSREGKAGAYTILDIPASYLSPHSKEKLLKDFM